MLSHRSFARQRHRNSQVAGTVVGSDQRIDFGSHTIGRSRTVTALSRSKVAVAADYYSRSCNPLNVL